VRGSRGKDGAHGCDLIPLVLLGKSLDADISAGVTPETCLVHSGVLLSCAVVWSGLVLRHMTVSYRVISLYGTRFRSLRCAKQRCLAASGEILAMGHKGNECRISGFSRDRLEIFELPRPGCRSEAFSKEYRRNGRSSRVCCPFEARSRAIPNAFALAGLFQISSG